MSQASTSTLGNNKTPCPICNESIAGRYLFNHFCTKHEKQVLAQNTKEGIEEVINLNQPFIAYNEDSIVSMGCLGCKKGLSNGHKATNHFQQDPECLRKHIEQLGIWKSLAKKNGKYSSKEVQEYSKKHGGNYKYTDDADKKRCGYLFLAAQLQGLDTYLAKSIQQIGIINKEFDMAVKILETINTKLVVSDVQEIYTTDWHKYIGRAWRWIEDIMHTYFHPTYHWDFMKYTPFPQPSGDPHQVELELYLNGDVETFVWKPIELQSVKEYENLKNPPNAAELFRKAYEEDLRKMKEQHEQLKRDKLEMAKRYKELEERALMAERSEDSDTDEPVKIEKTSKYSATPIVQSKFGNLIKSAKSSSVV
jgi:hypothetical protein